MPGSAPAAPVPLRWHNSTVVARRGRPGRRRGYAPVGAQADLQVAADQPTGPGVRVRPRASFHVYICSVGLVIWRLALVRAGPEAAGRSLRSSAPADHRHVTSVTGRFDTAHYPEFASPVTVRSSPFRTREMTVNNVVTIRGLDHRYGATHALRGVDLTVAAGECVAAGPQRRGQDDSSALTRMLAPSAGIVRIDGADPVGRPRAAGWASCTSRPASRAR